RAVDLWRIDPAPAASDDMDDAADHAAVINARFASRIGRKVRLKPRELRIRQPEKVLFHQGYRDSVRNVTSAGQKALNLRRIRRRTPSGEEAAEAYCLPQR